MLPYIVQDDQRLGPAAVCLANRVEHAVPDNGREQLLNKQREQDCADGCEVEVVDEEERLELEWLSVAHDFPAAEDEDVVGDDEDGRLLEGRHGRLAGDESEVVCGLARDRREGLVEDWPQMDAERSVDRRQRQVLQHFQRHGGGRP